jgi:hypothetical protein
MSEIKVNKISPRSGTAITLGDSSDTFTVPSGVGLTLTDSTLLLPTTINTDKLDPKSGTDLEIGSSGDTITIPSGATITNSGTATGFGGGKIAQVVTATKTDTYSATGPDNAFVDPGLTVAITPAASSSKFLVMCTTNLGCAQSEENAARLVRDLPSSDTVIAQGDALGARIRTFVGSRMPDSGDMEPYNMIVLDAPAQTAEITYKLQITMQSSSGSTVLFLNRSDSDGDDADTYRAASTLTVMEVLA